MRQAYHAESALKAEGLLTGAGQDPPRRRRIATGRHGRDADHPAAGRPAHLARTRRSTNPIESLIETCWEHPKNVNRWRDGTIALRWCAAGMLEADHQFRRVNGHLYLPRLRAALIASFTENVSTASQNEDQKVA